MVTNTVRDSLDQNWALLADDDFTSLLGRKVDSKQVIAIDTDRWHAICDTTSNDTIASILVIDRRRDGIHIVATVKECLAAQSRSKIQGGVEIAFGGCTLTKVCHSDTVIATNPIVISGSGCLWHLCAKRRRHSDNVHIAATIVDGHLFATAKIILIARKLVSHLLNREAAP